MHADTLTAPHIKPDNRRRTDFKILIACGACIADTAKPVYSQTLAATGGVSLLDAPDLHNRSDHEPLANAMLNHGASTGRANAIYLS